MSQVSAILVDVTEIVLPVALVLLAAAVLALALMRRSGSETPARFDAVERGLEREMLPNAEKVRAAMEELLGY